jgi:hypothetical protein
MSAVTVVRGPMMPWHDETPPFGGLSGRTVERNSAIWRSFGRAGAMALLELLQGKRIIFDDSAA